MVRSFCDPRIDRLITLYQLRGVISSPESGIARGILLRDGKELLEIQFIEASEGLCTAVNIQFIVDVLKMYFDRASGEK